MWITSRRFVYQFLNHFDAHTHVWKNRPYIAHVFGGHFTLLGGGGGGGGFNGLFCVFIIYLTFCVKIHIKNLNLNTLNIHVCTCTINRSDYDMYFTNVCEPFVK